MSNSKKITESLSESYLYSGNDSDAGAGTSLSRALRAMRGISGYDVRLEQTAKFAKKMALKLLQLRFYAVYTKTTRV